LLLVLNNTKNAKGILTGKFFEYLSANRPVICIGPTDGDASVIVNETRCGKCLNYTDFDNTYKIVLEYYELFKSGNLRVNNTGAEKYSRKNLTKEIADVLDKL